MQQQTLKALISEIAKNYNSVSYHNFTHGFALMQVFYSNSDALQVFQNGQKTIIDLHSRGKIILLISRYYPWCQPQYTIYYSDGTNNGF